MIGISQALFSLLDGERPNAHMHATSCGTVKLANDHCDPERKHSKFRNWFVPLILKHSSHVWFDNRLSSSGFSDSNFFTSSQTSQGGTTSPWA